MTLEANLLSMSMRFMLTQEAHAAWMYCKEERNVLINEESFRRKRANKFGNLGREFYRIFIGEGKTCFYRLPIRKSITNRFEGI
jgi:hypothetical protein